MFSKLLSLFFLALAFTALPSVFSVPVSNGINDLAVEKASLDKLDAQARSIIERATPAAPHFVIYSDKFVSGTTGPPPVNQVKGYNVL